MTAAPPLPRKASWLGQMLATVGAILSLIYLANFDAGIWELIPDIFPILGNIDEVLFTMLLVYCLRKLGIDLMPQLRSRNQGGNVLPP
jgi:hypothetical protein